MIVSLIVAMDENRGIAWRGQLPWHLPSELKLFKQTTQGHHLLMGRKTFESLGKVLPGRTTIVITHQKDYHPKGCLVAHSIQEGLSLARAGRENEVFVCGGGAIYTQALPLADRVYLTVVHASFKIDIIFPPLESDSWRLIDTIYHPADAKNAFAFTRNIFEKSPDAEVSMQSRNVPFSAK